MIYDAAIIGGGVVGLSIAHALSSAGFSVCVLEKEVHLLEWASGSNSGILCTGVDASIGTLERALIRDSISCTIPYYDQMNLPMRPCGSLVCQWQRSDEETTTDSGSTPCTAALERVLAESHQAGDAHAALLSKENLLLREPHLNCDLASGAIHIPNEIVVDPWLHAISYAVRARQNGASIYTSFEVDSDRSSFDPAKGVWTLERRSTTKGSTSLEKALPVNTVRATAVINAAGLWADLLHGSMTSKPPSWSSRPRRGQYLVLQPNNGASVQHPIQPIPTQHTKGIFIFSTLYGQLVVGPTAQEQQSRTDRTVCEKTRESLLSYVKTVIPQLDATIIGDYVGIRPATNKRDYQIHVETEQNWVSCSGIRSTGLTASLGIGRHVRELLKAIGILVPKDDSYKPVCRPLPSVDELAKQFQESEDGSVEIDGFRYHVTHPLTRWGWLCQQPESKRANPACI